MRVDAPIAKSGFENQAAQGLVDDIGEHGAQKHQTVIDRKEALAHVSWIALPLTVPLASIRF